MLDKRKLPIELSQSLPIIIFFILNKFNFNSFNNIFKNFKKSNIQFLGKNIIRL